MEGPSTTPPETEAENSELIGGATSPESTDPFEECKERLESELTVLLMDECDEPTDCPVHPYLDDITKCPSNEWQLQKVDPIPFKSLDETPYTLVDKNEILGEMMSKLKMEQEVALGTKRSAHRSFNGINCLIQIATRSEVYLVDTIELKEEVLVLNEIFASPNVLKVGQVEDGFHVLQKDLGLYMVNLFSPSIAWKALNGKGTDIDKIGKHPGLKTQLEEHCGVNYKTIMGNSTAAELLSTWHIRPLSDDNVKDARLGVQYLLHIYDKFRNMLIDADILLEVYQACNDTCKPVWYPGKDSLKPTSHLSLYKTMAEGARGQKKTRRRLNKVEMEVFRLLYDWRHTTAEKHNENVQYLLKNDALYRICRSLPTDVEGIKKCFKADTAISPLLEEGFSHICELVAKTVKSFSCDPDKDEKVSFFPEEMDARRKRAADWEAKHKCPICKKARHGTGQTCKKKKTKKKPKKKPPFRNNVLPLSHPLFPNIPITRPPPFVMAPRVVPSVGTPMRMPPRPWGW